MSNQKESNSAQLSSSNDLDCSICMEMYNEPKLLPCGHMFCHKCVLQLKKGAPLTSSLARKVKIKCPNCRALVSVPKHAALPTVFTVKGMLSEY
uniref:RING-type domain-containing protein n=1 Tax=Ditylenchus dipsaci TaxID=166011 RepID=A0A915DNA7_9BILA